jgi:hypothetical protein
VMGAFEHQASGPGQPGGPKIRVNGFAFWGAVEVKRKPPRGAKKRRDVRDGPRRPELGDADGQEPV